MAVTASLKQSSPAQSILCTGTKQEPNWSRFQQTKAEMSLPTDGRINFEPENTTQSSWCSDSNPPSQLGLPCPPESLWDNSLRSQNYPDKSGLPCSVPLFKFFPLFGMSFPLPMSDPHFLSELSSRSCSSTISFAKPSQFRELDYLLS